MKFIADFHIHSKYSRATAKNADLENLYISAQLKCINVIGTGDFTHPGWFQEISNKLVPAEEGLFKLREDMEASLNASVPPACRRDVRFILTAEISNIYKKNGKTRKNHNLVFIPDISTAAAFNAALERIGNIHSDGRPILGLDARHLLEILLETSEKNFLVPAHIWTPWFSLLGSKSGFDTLEECFEDLTSHIFAVETGLSSDPPMNWRIKFLDGLTLISNSDAHSPHKLGREANLFNTELSFRHIRQAMETGDPASFLGTMEFYPEEGKYHLDGHRKCDFRSWPRDTMTREGICPVCDKPMTLGVLYRVEELADRPEGNLPEKRHEFHSMIPLKEILSEILGVGPNTKKVAYHYERLLNRLGPELDIIKSLSIEQIASVDFPYLGEAIQRVRRKEVKVHPGYDGEFGRISLFDKKEKGALSGQKKLFNIPKIESEKKRVKPGSVCLTKKKNPKANQKEKIIDLPTATLNEQQNRAVYHGKGPLIIVAGPGTGKTLTITRRIAHLIESRKANSENILALTFTNKAAEEMYRRLNHLLGGEKGRPQATTFHAFCIHVLQRIEKICNFRVIDEIERHYFFNQAAATIKKACRDVGLNINNMADRIAAEKQHIRGPHKRPAAIKDIGERIFQQVFSRYQNVLHREGLWDFEDLIFQVVLRLEESPNLAKRLQRQYKYIFVDEYQDINYAQYCIIKHLAPSEANICVIGDPDQSIYGFRGSDVRYFNRFTRDYPRTLSIKLARSYRSAQVVLDASQQMIASARKGRDTRRLFSKINGPETIGILPCGTEKEEAVVIGKEIEHLVGGLGFYSIDFDKTDTVVEDYAFGDFAVLVRTGRQCNQFAEAFRRAGIPFQIASKENAFSQKSVNITLSLIKILEKSGSYMDLEGVAKYTGSGLGIKSLTTWKKWAFEHNYAFLEALDNTRRFPVPDLSKERQRRFVQFIDNIDRMQSATKGMNLSEKIHSVLNSTSVLEKLVLDRDARSALEAFIEKSKQFQTVVDLCQTTALQTDTDFFDRRTEKVSLMTMHASKGLEFPVVFISGCENGLIPFQREEGVCENEDEERRLLYVAMTRAKQDLFLSFAKRRNVFGKTASRRPSDFIRNIAENLKHYRHAQVGRQKNNSHIQLELFSE